MSFEFSRESVSSFLSNSVAARRAISSLFEVIRCRLIDIQLPAINSTADALLFLNAASGVFPPDIACEQLLAFPVIDVLIEGLDQQFSMLLAENHHLTCREFIQSSIEGFGPALSTVFFAALLFCDENPREHQVRSHPGIWEKTGVLHFRVRSLHAAKTLVQLISNRFRTSSVDQQPVARLCFLSEQHEAEIAARAATPSLQAAGPEAGVLTTL